MRNVVNLGTGKVRLKFRKCTNLTLAKPALYSLSPFLCFSWQDRSSIALEEPKGKVHRLFLTPSLQTVLFQMKTNPVFFFTTRWDFIISQLVLSEPNSLCFETTGRTDFAGNKRFLHPHCQVSLDLGLWSHSQSQGSFPDSLNQSYAIFPPTSCA